MPTLPQNTRPCSRCKTELNAPGSTYCHACYNAWKKAYRARDPEKSREYSTRSSREWRQRNPERAREIDRRKYWTNRKYNPRWKLGNLRRVTAYNRRNGAKPRIYRTPERIKADQLYWARMRRLRERGATGSHTLTQFRLLCQKYEYRCLCCGQQEPSIKLEADHVLPLSRGGTDDISNIQPLCGRCNRKKFTKHIDYR